MTSVTYEEPLDTIWRIFHAKRQKKLCYLTIDKADMIMVLYLQ